MYRCKPCEAPISHPRSPEICKEFGVPELSVNRYISQGLQQRDEEEEEEEEERKKKLGKCTVYHKNTSFRN
jgi:hypothetical protein